MPPKRSESSAGRARRTVAILPLLTFLAAVPAVVHAAGSSDGQPKILLHRMSVTAKNLCNRGALADCGEAVTTGTIGTPAFVYLLGARGWLESVASVEVGINYQSGLPADMSDHAGIDIHSWTKCASLEFPTPGSSLWPRPGGGNLVVWDAVNACQTGPTAVAGYFYLTAYSADELRLITRPASNGATVTTCSAIETQLDVSHLGSIRFSPGGLDAGCNPCLGPCGEEPPACHVSATTIDFGAVYVDDSPAPRLFTITNVGGGRLIGSIEGATSAFSVGPTSYSLGPQQSANVLIYFRPPATAGPCSTSLHVSPGCPDIQVTGSTRYATRCVIQGGEINFGVVPVGETVMRGARLGNSGQLPITTTLSSPQSEISFPDGATVSMAPGEVVTVPVLFRPSVAGVFQGTINAGLCGTARLSGFGDDSTPPICVVTPSILDFGPVAIGQESTSLMFGVRNDGGSCMQLSPEITCPTFSWGFRGYPGLPICNGMTRGGEIVFHPQAIGTFECRVDLGGSACQDVILRGEGRLPAAGVFTPSLVDFGSVPPGSSALRTIKLTNTGSTPIVGTLSAVCGVFTVVDVPAFSLAPGASRDYLVSFHPNATGDFRCTIDAGTTANPLLLTGVAEAVVPIQSSTWSGIKSRFGH